MRTCLCVFVRTCLLVCLSVYVSVYLLGYMLIVCISVFMLYLSVFLLSVCFIEIDNALAQILYILFF